MSSDTVYDPQQKMWSAPKRVMALDTNKSLGEHLYERMLQDPNKICQITHPEGTTLTYKEALGLSIKVAQYLESFQLGKDDVVGVIAKNSTMLLPIFVGCWLNTIPFFPIYKEKNQDFIARLFGLMRPKVVFCDAGELKELQAACELIKLTPKVITIDVSVKGVMHVREIFASEIETSDFRPKKLTDGSTQTSIYLSTSGTTGFPKPMHFSNEHLLLDRRINTNISIILCLDFIARLFGLMRPKVVFCDAGELKELQAACELIKLTPKVITIDVSVKGVMHVREIFASEIETSDFRPKKLTDGSTQTSIYLSTSGTTGFPKPMHFSNEHLLLDRRPLSSDCIMFSFNNPNWICGLRSLYFALLCGCTRIITSLPSDSEFLFELIPKYKITHLWMLTPEYARMTKCFAAKPRDLSSLKFLGISGATLSPTICQQAQKMLPAGIVGNFYGGNEWGIVAVNKKYHKPSAVGQLRPGYRAKIASESGTFLGTNEIGEVILHNDRDWKGYVGNTKETALIRDADGWFHTGDLGYFDEDGDLFLVDRKKDVIRTRVYDITPSDIERVVTELADVVEACAFGIKDDFEDRPAVAVMLRKDSTLSKLDIQEHVARKCPQHMHLCGGVYFLNNFPKTDTGKISRKDIRDLVNLKQIN